MIPERPDIENTQPYEPRSIADFRLIQQYTPAVGAASLDESPAGFDKASANPRVAKADSRFACQGYHESPLLKMFSFQATLHFRSSPN
jgi:hypothetical protein